MIFRHAFPVLASCAALWSFVCAAVLAAPPNILLILTDDQGFGDVAIHGNRAIATPNMDRIATEGARCERFFVEPVCAPTRAAILSGRFPTRTGVTGVTRGWENMRGEEVTIAELLRDEAGYATGCFGKWHNGAHWPYHPNAQGFSEFVGFCGGHWNDYYDPVLQRNGHEFQARGFIADVLTDYAIAFMERAHEAGNGPFFCYLPYNTPHTPASVPVEEWRRWQDRADVEDEFTRAMYALVENIDSNIGRLLATLDALGIAGDTVVLFLTDNGPNGDRFNDAMLGRKGSEHEGGVRVPLFIRWTGRIAPGTVIKPNLAHIDLLPTLCALAEIKDPGAKTLPLDGLDFSSLLLGEGDDTVADRHLFVWRTPQKWSVRSAQYRATETTLHDLWNDPSQKTNLAKKMPELHRELIDSYRKWAAMATPAVPQPLPVHIGHAEWPRVTINAHEFALLPGAGKGIDYCGPQGYANQWIERWTQTDAWATCPVNVVQEGRYRVTLRYACPADAAGSVFRVHCGEASLDVTIEEPWISAVTPSSTVASGRHDYLSRDWKDVVAGEIELPKGEFTLELRAVTKPGAAMPDFKALILEQL